MFAIETHDLTPAQVRSGSNEQTDPGEPQDDSSPIPTDSSENRRTRPACPEEQTRCRCPVPGRTLEMTAPAPLEGRHITRDELDIELIDDLRDTGDMSQGNQQGLDFVREDGPPQDHSSSNHFDMDRMRMADNPADARSHVLQQRVIGRDSPRRAGKGDCCTLHPVRQIERADGQCASQHQESVSAAIEQVGAAIPA
jgi:hypothetical protein